MYTLYKEHWYLDNGIKKKHICEKEEFGTIEEARQEMEADYDMLSPGNNSSLLLKYSFIIIHYGANDRCDRMIHYGILENMARD